ncbi:MAG: CehA/McbA family metallohydrolase [Solirubrobacterales bacterium]
MGRIALGIALLAAPPSASAGVVPLVGSLHEHSGYSDGWPGSRPQAYFDSGRSFGLDFMGGSEHSDNADLPIVASEYCLDPLVAPQCALADPVEPLNSFRKWDAALEQARAASTPTFTAFRGFEWTSDRFGHINVYFSRHDANAKGDGGYATMEAFYSWFTRAASLGGGSDGLATFNHPGAKSLSGDDPGFNWNDLAHVPEADARMVGIEVFNDNDEFAGPGRGGGYAAGAYAHALDRGWHLGAVGAEDLGHRRSDDWGGPGWPKTVILAEDRSEPALKAAMLARRFYAIRRPGISLAYTADGRPMGSRLTRTEGRPLKVRATINDPAASLQLVTSGGRVVASGLGSLAANPKASGSDRYYFIRALGAQGDPIAYSSPVWVTALPRSGPDGGEWLAGDLHVHSCFSHDAYCPPNDDNTGPDEFYTLGLDVGQRFLEASARGLDYLAITDHNDVRSSADPDFGSFGVVGIPGYENSLQGHAQMLGASRLYEKGDSSAAAVNAMAQALRADGGALQANHPADGIEQPFDSCDDTGVLDWEYAYDVRPDTLEVWNVTSSIQVAERYWECWLERGARLGATGGSDSHWLSTVAVQGVGNPTTWVFARDRSREAILEAIRSGRTSVGRIPPGQGGGPFLLEADGDGDGSFESTVGDTVRPGSQMRVRASGLPAAGLVKVRANGAPLVDEALLGPGGELRFRAPEQGGWVRANLLLAPSESQGAPGCDPNGAPITTCAYDYLTAAVTSPIYLGR